MTADPTFSVGTGPLGDAEEEIATTFDDRARCTASRFDTECFAAGTEYEQGFLATHRVELETWGLAHEGLGP